jgi:peptidoglycan/xylan/chitin deacetylase (PgdA/CDA1 family)
MIYAMATLPHYYSRLSPFRDCFLRGTPILTYHHVGRRKTRARIKGLYVSPRLFANQISELRAAGFSTATFQSVIALQKSQQKRIFISFDDGYRDVLEHALPPLGASGFSAIQFLVADLLGKTNEWQQRAGDVVEPLMDEVQVRDWLMAGHEIGAHTCSHAHLTRISAFQAREEISASKKKLEDLFGRRIRHFCYPYGDWNQAVRDLVQEAGYDSACSTQFGINMQSADPFALKRITARYPSRTWRRFWSWLTVRPQAALGIWT